MVFFSSPTSNIPTSAFAIAMHSSAASTAMMRTSSSDSTRSTSSYSSSSAMAIPMMSSPHSSSQRRSSSSSSTSACGWVPSPFRSCQMADESSSYLSDDDLLFLSPPTQLDRPAPKQPERELSTEEQIALLREQAEREDQDHHHHHHHHHQPRPEAWWVPQPRYAEIKKAKAVRFAGEVKTSQHSRRPSSTSMQQKRRTPTVRRNLADLGTH